MIKNATQHQKLFNYSLDGSSMLVFRSPRQIGKNSPFGKLTLRNSNSQKLKGVEKMKGKIKIKKLEVKKGMYLRDKDFHGNSGWTLASKWFWNQVKERVGEVVKAEMRINTKDIPYLILYTTNDIKVCLYGLNAGYGGTGPQAAVEILSEAGFNPKRAKETVFNRETFILRRRPKGVA
ncbi:hypothetical protein [Priestia megaterium]|uniref:hypothetical protein n=1 Tax=Priestia megaterium TaxID=1404 RepID=UPI002FFFDBA2